MKTHSFSYTQNFGSVMECSGFGVQCSGRKIVPVLGSRARPQRSGPRPRTRTVFEQTSRTRTTTSTSPIGSRSPRALTVAVLLLALGLPLCAAEPPAGAAPVAGVTASVAPARVTNSVGMALIAVSAGEYLCYGRDIKPEFLFPKPKAFKVKVEKAFSIGATEVTKKQYAKVMGLKTGFFAKGLDQPVAKVNWNDAVAFCQKLSELPAEKAAGRVYSLPTEREWQFAARAGSEYMFPYGSDDEMRVAEVAVCRDIYTHALPPGPAAVGTKKSNAWGLYDVLGNVWEWVQDAWPPDLPPSYPPATASAAALDKGDNRVIVGGGWDNDFRMCNLAARYSAPPTRKANNIGFRVRCTIVPASAEPKTEPQGGK